MNRADAAQTATPASDLPRQARVVIAGGGIIGCSVAYHLTLLGWKDVLLLEQNRLAGGTTWHAAGMVGRLRNSSAMTRINKYSAELYAGLEAETGIDTGWRKCGSVIVGNTPERMEQLKRNAAMSAVFDVDVQLIGVDEIRERWPLLCTDDLAGGVWLPDDGRVVPEQVTLALAQGARNRGAQIFEDVRIQNVLTDNGRAVGVETSRGDIQAEFVVLCCGMWTRELGLRCGVIIPLYPVEHHYIVSEPIKGVHDDLPLGRNQDTAIYFRPENGNQIMVGAFQKYSKPWMVDHVPDDFSFDLLEPDWEKFAQPLAAAKQLIPALREAEFPKFVNGPESFTPDNNYILGEAPEIRQLFVAAGFNSLGIASAGGAGKTLAEWMIAGEPTMDLWSVDIRRFTNFHNNVNYLRERVSEVLGIHYQMAWPNREWETGRNVRKSPIHDRLAEQGACFGNKMGWERPLWYAPAGVEPVMEYAFGKQNWFDHSAAEHRAAREGVAIFDQTSFSKFVFEGKDTVDILQYLCGNDVDVEPGQAVYTGLFNERGTFESDLTVIRDAVDRYYVVTATSQTTHDAAWIRRHTKVGADATLTDVTDSHSVLGVMGPRARDLMQQVTSDDVSNATFPFGTSRFLRIGDAEVRAVRLTYVGELGWELHIAMSDLPKVYEALLEAGRNLGVVHAGHYAINSLRLEKGYRTWGHDISPDDTPLEAGLSFAVAWDKPVPFLGREALVRQREEGVRKRLAIFILDDPDSMLWGNEPIFRNGGLVGYTTSGAYGHTVGGAVGMGYARGSGPCTPDFIKSGEYEIEVTGQRVSASVHLRAPYDAKRARILC